MSHTTTDKLFLVLFLGFRGAALNQSRRASGVYTGLPVFWHRRSDSFEETTKCAFEAFEFVLDVFVLGDRGSRNTKPAYQGDGSQWRTIPHIKDGGHFKPSRVASLLLLTAFRS